MPVLEEVAADSTHWITLTFINKDGAEEAPSSVVYKVIDKASGEVVKAEETINNPSESLEVKLGKDVNAIQDSGLSKETRVVLAEAIYGPDDSIEDKYEYVVVDKS